MVLTDEWALGAVVVVQPRVGWKGRSRVILAKKKPRRGEVAGGEKGVPVVPARREWWRREMHPVMSAIERGYERPGIGHRSEGDPPAGACRRQV